MRLLASSICMDHTWVKRHDAVALCCAALSPAPADAQVPPPFTAGLLWRVAKAGGPESFVFGTIHVADPDVKRELLAREEGGAREQFALAAPDVEDARSRLDKRQGLGDAPLLQPTVCGGHAVPLAAPPLTGWEGRPRGASRP